MSASGLRAMLEEGAGAAMESEAKRVAKRITTVDYFMI